MENNLFSYWKDGNTHLSIPVGDPNGEPFRVSCRSRNLNGYGGVVLLDIVVFARNVGDVEARVFHAFDTCIRLAEESGYKPTHYCLKLNHEQNICRVKELREIGLTVEPFDKRYATKFPWACNDTLLQ